MSTGTPSAAQIAALLEKHGTPPQVIAHGEAVARCALELASQLTAPVDTKLLEAACFLHDIARGQSDHAHAGGELLTREGYPEIGATVAQHHDLPEHASAEASLLYLADKLAQGTERVSLEARFSASRKKCTTPEALAAWQRRRERTLRILQEFRLTLPENEVFYE